MSIRYRRRLLAGAAFACLLATPALAQQGPQPKPEPDPAASGPDQATIEEIIVTGSHIERAGFSAPTPVTVIGSDILETRAPSVLVDALKFLPAFRKTSTPTTAGVSVSGTGGQSFANLRGLDPRRTLVLFDGQRMVPTTNTETVDLALLPQIFVNRVDVVTGGASAAYGSDAVAGVVNFIVDSRFKGLDAQLETGISTHGDGASRKAALRWGGTLGSVHLIAGGEYYKNDGLDARSRDYFTAPYGVVSNPAYVAGNGQLPLILTRYNYTPNSTFGGLIVGGPLANTEFLSGGATRVITPCSPQTSTYQLCPGRRDDLPFNSYEAMLASPQERGTAFARATVDLGGDAEAYVDGLYGKSVTRFQTVPAATALNGLITIKNDNAFLPAQIRSQMAALGLTSFQLGRFSHDNGPTKATRTAEVWRLSAGLRMGLGAGWTLKASASYGESRLETLTYNTPIRARYAQAIDAVISPTTGQPVCRSTLTDPSNGCVPVNLFGVGSPSAAALGYFLGAAEADLRTRLTTLDASLSGEPFSTWAGPVSLAVGGQYRHESLAQTVDPLSAANAFIYTNPQPLSGAIDVVEGYAETVVPLARDLPFAHNLELNAAARVTHYSTSGTVATWKVGGNYEPVEGLRFRVTRSRDIRAPNIVELQSPRVMQTSNSPAIDPRNLQPISVSTFTSGNAGLVPEKADTFSAGVVVQPRFLPGFSLSVDYFDIKIDGAISQLALQPILNGCQAGDQNLCGFITRDATGKPVSVTSSYFNFQQIRTNGIDIEAAYRADLRRLGIASGGTLTLRGLANRLGKYDIGNAGVITNALGDINVFTLPRWTLDLSALYERGGTTLGMDASYLGSGNYQNSLIGQLQNNHIEGVWYLNLSAEQEIGWGEGRTFTLYGRIDNLLNREPPFGFGGGGGNYDRYGRFFKVGVRVRM
ncbi:TonB-dependent receptor plug domain-containing protein [Novosphingobium mathurense]|uniref:TonB-dependent Receptor Plug Domain n=1 Tax=Novosphingobium mathurense TaxID=428990 RepID=A0A1U6H653_9SPHN|nr:TonB-dependent receptor [Novosphingobium mathurense]SLJ91255.1 TonB-dependent Receptor Plug Domain [Novosphingobium mathurense]